MYPYKTPDSITAWELKTKRKALGFTQKSFAEFIGVSKPTIERWETSEKPLTGPIVLLMQLLTPEFIEQVKKKNTKE